MNREQVKAALPIIQAFAEGRPVQFRNLPLSTEWITLNPNTTEFRLSEFDPREWRVDPGQDEPDLRSRLSESEAAVRVLSEHYQKYAALVESERPDMDEWALDECIKAQHSAIGDLLQAFHNLPSSAAANAESHRRMRECLEACLRRYWKDVSRQPPEWWYVTDSIIAAQDALNPAVASAGKLHQELQGERIQAILDTINHSQDDRDMTESEAKAYREAGIAPAELHGKEG